VLLELFISFSYIETQSPTDFTEEYGRCRRQNMNYVYFNEGFSMGRFNEGRYLNSYYPIDKPKGVIRIAALGDSYVEGFQVFERNHFLKIAEEKLNNKLNDSVQILNFGRSGFDFGDMYAYYNIIVKQYKCDYVLFFISNTDLNIRQTDKLIPKVVIDSSGFIIISNKLMPLGYKNIFIRQLKYSHRSSIYNMLNKGKKLIQGGELFPKLFDKFYFDNSLNGEIKPLGLSEIIVSEKAYQILDKLKSENSKVIIINRGKEKLDNMFVKEMGDSVSYFDLIQESNLYNSEFNPHYWKITKKIGHWNLKAHRIVGEEMYNYLLKRINLK